jgi:hypothetical protein
LILCFSQPCFATIVSDLVDELCTAMVVAVLAAVMAALDATVQDESLLKHSGSEALNVTVFVVTAIKRVCRLD